MPATFDPFALAAIVLALGLGGVMKGATGAGAPVVAVPVIAAFFDVRLGVILMATPNMMTNSWQLWAYRHALPSGGFAFWFAFGAATGTAIGTFLLASLPERALIATVAGAVVMYISLRLARPDLKLPIALARKLLAPVSVTAGILQGAAGISAPISVSFLNAMRLDRPAFIALVSACFFGMALVQVPMLFVTGLMSVELLGLSVFAVIPLLLGMPVGAWLAKRLTPDAFDKLVLTLLAVLALRLIYAAYTG